MKKHLQSLLLITLLMGMSCATWAQTSTEGKEFWVALLMANSPSGFSGSTFKPFIAISAKKACTVAISNPAQGWTRDTQSVTADSWTVIDDIPIDKWYDKDWTASNASEKITKLGIKVEATEEVSVYAAIRMEYSYDASNILPVTALGSEYLIQDYPTYNKGEAHSIFTIVATEDNTTVEIMPSIPTIKGTDTRITVDLKKGETYQVVSTPEKSFAGTRIHAYSTIDHSDPKNIAVFSGADFTQVPGGKSARDCLYEQAMPTDYWGTEFVVTRSKEKDANRIRITALDSPTDIFIDGNPMQVKTLQPGETWEFELSEDLASTEMAKYITDPDVNREIPPILKGEAHYIKTSCPVAVFSYDVSSEYKFEASEKIGDPSMVWISPLQQRISKITFGACGTSGSTGHTNRHYVNIVCLTSDVPSVKLSSEKRAKIDVNFSEVPGNPEYSYACIFLVDTDKPDADKVYTLSADNGVVAHVYGSGYNESYAYSVGSAAVKRGISVNGKVYTDGYVGETRLCFGGMVEFNAQVGNDDIERVDWNFGDGTSITSGPAIITHEYTAATWYDVTATLYGHQVCTDEADQELGTISFSFRIGRPDTIRHSPIKVCEPEGYTGPLMVIDTVTYPEGGCDSVVITPYLHPAASSHEFDTIAKDICTIAGKTFTNSIDTTWTIENYLGCDSVITCHLTIIKCLDLQIVNRPDTQHVCKGEQYGLPISYDRDAKPGDAYLVISEVKKEPIDFTGATTVGTRKLDTLLLPMEKWEPGLYTVKVQMEDVNCDTVFESTELNFTVNYPENIFAFKFNNVLAVYHKGYGGNTGYDFTAYQWYHNDELISGATQSTYHTDAPFTPGDTYYVMLTDINTLTLPSCRFTVPDEIDDYNPKSSAPAAVKKLINRHIYIVVDDRMYDAYGSRVK